MKFDNKNISSLQKQEKLSLLHQLVKMAKADSVFKTVEHKYLVEIAQLLEVSLDQLEDIIGDNVVHILPKTHNDRIKQIYRLTVMMMIDGIVTVEEVAVLKEYAIELGLRPEAIEVMIRRMQSNKGGMLLLKDLQEIFLIEAN